jgi:hypothetical protein
MIKPPSPKGVFTNSPVTKGKFDRLLNRIVDVERSLPTGQAGVATKA